MHRFKACNSQNGEVRKGPWTMEEDLILINHIANHGEGAWNSLAKAAGLKRTGKSCRLRWLNYLRPGVRRGNITAEEELLIMELHDKWGNRWSKIAKHLPGRTDNEIKNYWRTKIQKQIKQAEANSNCSPANDEEQLMDIQHMISYSTPSDFIMETDDQLVPTTSYHQGGASNITNINMHDASFSVSASHTYNCPLDFTDNCWSMDDIWSMQLLN